MRSALTLVLAVLALPVAAQPASELARDVLAGCLAEQDGTDPAALQACYYEAASAFDTPDDGPAMTGDPAIEAELADCIDRQFDTDGAADCLLAASVAYRGALGDLDDEVLSGLSGAEAESYREAAEAWADYVQAEIGYLDAMADPDRFADPGAAELAALDREERLLGLFRERYARLASVPRG